MIIFIAPIKNKKHEWKPKQNDFFWQETLDYIFKEEELDKDTSYEPIHNVSFNAQTLTYDSIRYKPQESKILNTTNEIFYVKTTLQKVLPNKDETGYWCYVSSFDRNEDNSVSITLTIDTVSSSLIDFENNKYAGECYTERSNNKEVEENLIHPDVCVSIQNQQENYQKAGNGISIIGFCDTFFISFLSLENQKTIRYKNGSTGAFFDLEEKGGVLTDEVRNTKFQGYWSVVTNPANSRIITGSTYLPSDTLERILSRYSDSQVDDPIWIFDSPPQYKTFIEKLQEAYPTNEPNLLNEVDKIVKNDKIQKWITIPKIFNFTEQAYSKVTFSLKFFNIDKKNHLFLHKKYFLVWSKLFKIPLDPLKIKDMQIIITRVVNYSGVIYSFYYSEADCEAFYTLNVTVENGMLSNQHIQNQKNLNNAYETGLKGDVTGNLEATISGTLNILTTLGLLSASSPLGLANPATLGLKTLSIGALFGTSLISKGNETIFSKYRENRQNEYESKKINSLPNTSKNILDYESFIKTFSDRIYNTQFSYFKTYLPNQDQRTGYLATSIKNIYTQPDLSFYLLIEEPVKSDIEIIETDQKLFGAVQSRYELNCQNPLIFNELTTNHLYWKGRILPTENFVNSFWTENLNETLSQGVIVRKKKFN